MTDDFDLLPARDAGGTDADDDVSLIAAYLSRELTLIQIVAVQDRLAADPSFRERVEPIIEAWTVPGSWDERRRATAGVKRRSMTSLTPEEVDAGWQRSQGAATPRSHRRHVRAAAAIGLIVLPLLAIAQVVVKSRRQASTATIPPVAAFEVNEHRVAVPLAEPLLSTGGGRSRQQPLVTQLAALERLPVVFRGLPSIRPLSDHSVIVSDSYTRMLYRFDSTLGLPRVLIDSAGNAGTRRYPEIGGGRGASQGLLSAGSGDSTLFFNLPSQTYFVVAPDGQVARSLPGAPGSAAFGVNYMRASLPRHDGRGTWYSLVVGSGPRGSVSPIDSAPLLSVSAAGRNIVTWLRVATYYPAANRSNPVPVNDDWTLLPDGGVAVVRAKDFHVDWYDVTGAKRATPRVPYAWRPLTAQHKQALLDSLHRHFATLPVGAPAAGGFTAPAGRVPENVPISVLPDSEPPFSGYTAIADLEGRIWIRVADGALPPWFDGVGAMAAELHGTRLRSSGRAPLYYVIDQSGAVARQVRLPNLASEPPTMYLGTLHPAEWMPIGFGPGNTVYLAWHKSTREWVLARTRY